MEIPHTATQILYLTILHLLLNGSPGGQTGNCTMRRQRAIKAGNCLTEACDINMSRIYCECGLWTKIRCFIKLLHTVATTSVIPVE